jgi:ribonuclease J
MDHPEENIVSPSLGSVIEVHGHSIGITSTVQAGPVLIEGYSVSDITQSVITERRILSQNGVMVVVVQLNKRYKTIEGEPEIFTKGFAYSQDGSEINYNLQRVIREATLANITMEGINWRNMKRAIIDNVGRYLSEKMKRTPLVIPIILSTK